MSQVAHPVHNHAHLSLVLRHGQVHLLACGLHLVAELETHVDPDMHTWLHEQADSGGIPPLDNATKSDRYIISAYWSVMTLTTIGYGDISMKTKAERCYAIFCMIVGAVSFAYVLGNVQNIIANFDSSGKIIRCARRARGVRAAVRALQ
eukprot:3520358-Prymnesium_polylepis.1